MIIDGDIAISSPLLLPGIEPEYCPAVVLAYYTELSRITRSIYGQTRKSGSNLMASVQAIMSDLYIWHRNIPPELRPGLCVNK